VWPEQQLPHTFRIFGDTPAGRLALITGRDNVEQAPSPAQTQAQFTAPSKNSRGRLFHISLINQKPLRACPFRPGFMIFAKNILAW
jgi:hypothetical protein